MGHDMTTNEPITAMDIHFQYNDGGRAAAGYRGETGDCACRAVAIATGLPYATVYADLIEWAATGSIHSTLAVRSRRNQADMPMA